MAARDKEMSHFVQQQGTQHTHHVDHTIPPVKPQHASPVGKHGTRLSGRDALALGVDKRVAWLDFDRPW